MANRLTKKNGLGKFRVGNKVKVRFGESRLRAQIVEDRGSIGVKGRRLVRIKLLGGSGDTEPTFVVPVEDLIRAKTAG